jgi:hypothetical protein
MPGSYTIDPKNSIVFSRAWGALTDAELAAHARALQEDPHFDPGFRQLADFRDVGELRVTAEGVRSLVHLNPFAKDARRAFVVGTDVMYGMVRMYQLTLDVEPGSIHVCRSMDEALEWLGLDRSLKWPAGPADATFDIKPAS